MAEWRATAPPSGAQSHAGPADSVCVLGHGGYKTEIAIVIGIGIGIVIA